MIKKVCWLLLFLLLILVVKQGSKYLESPSSPKDKVGIHPLFFYDANAFIKGIKLAENIKKPAFAITGGITPHHLEVSFILNDFYKRLSFQNIHTVILVGPNHYEKGNFKVLTSLYNWDTPFGVVEANRQMVKHLISKDLARVDEVVLPNDHSVAGSMSFIKYYLPEAKVVPLILSGTMKEEESRVLADSLKEFIKEGVVIVAPVDFSHYLNSKLAWEKDKITEKVMENFDYRQLFSLNNDYLDSPPSIAVILMVMQALGKTNMDILYHSNSGEIQKNYHIETTSYFEIAFY